VFVQWIILVLVICVLVDERERMSDADYIKSLEKDNYELRRANALLRKDPKLVSFKYEEGCNKIHFSFSPEAINDLISQYNFGSDDVKNILRDSFIKQISKEIDDILSEPDTLKKMGL
jgi:hypothetical protein